MKEKKLYEEAKIEIINFECDDIITTSSVFPGEEILPPDEGGTSGDIQTPEIEF